MWGKKWHRFCQLNNLTIFWQMQIDAHRSPLAAMVLSFDGMYIATASEQGTIIRIHLVSKATKVNASYSFNFYRYLNCNLNFTMMTGNFYSEICCWIPVYLISILFPKHVLRGHTFWRSTSGILSYVYIARFFVMVPSSVISSSSMSLCWNVLPSFPSHIIQCKDPKDSIIS